MIGKIMNNVEEESAMDIDAIMLRLDNLYNAGYYDKIMNNVEEESAMDIDAIMLGLDNLYNAGYYDCKKERDYDPRGKGQWQGLMDMFKQSMKNNNPSSNKSKPLTEREIRILSTLFPNKLSYEDVELIVRRVEYLHDIGL